MTQTDLIFQKLKAFIRKYYYNKLLRGSILFLTIGLLYFFASVYFEWLFWLSTTGRLILFWVFVVVESILFLRFICWPLSQLLKWSKGISQLEAAQLIGKYFPEVDDKLLNILQLQQDAQHTHSDLLLASIAQKSEALALVPFPKAISFKSNAKYLKYLAIPVLLFLLIFGLGKGVDFSNSYQRLINYQQAYTPPAPFHFVLLNDSLNAVEKQNFTLQVKTMGKVKPEQITLLMNDESYLLTELDSAVFAYQFKNLSSDVRFRLQANELISPEYTLKVLEVPQILDFKMQLHFPKYIKRQPKVISGTGNAQVPEGTKIDWALKTENASQIEFITADTSQLFQSQKNAFLYTQKFYSDLDYEVATSNAALENYEKLAYHISVIKDAYPDIKLQKKIDSTAEEKWYFKGEITDDYGLSKLQLVYYPVQNSQKITRKSIPVKLESYAQFYAQFPGDLKLKSGQAYTFYFEVFDNDQIHGAKKTRSSQFTYYKKSLDEEKREILQNTKSNLKSISQSLADFQHSDVKFEELKQMNLQKQNLNYRERTKFKDYINQSLREQKQLQSAFDKMKTDFKKFKSTDSTARKDNLIERMKRSEKRLNESEKIMEELQKYWRKIPTDNMVQQLDKLAKRKSNHTRNLKQLLELTKRYYVEEKTKALAQQLQKMADEQERLAKENLEQKETQQQAELNKKFNALKKELDALQKENANLKSPFKLDLEQQKQEAIAKEQQQALQNLQQQSPQKNTSQQQQQAQPHQQSAGQKMRSLSQKMQGQMQSGNRQQLKADIKTLRLILDNLITFSESQEGLMDWFQAASNEHPDFGNKLNRQQMLKDNFEHVDDSLYTLALHNPMISDKVLTTLNEVNFNMDKALERLANNKLNTGTSSQQYVMTNSNELANMLDAILQNMQMQMQGSGQGQGMPKPGQGQPSPGRGFQLPDIIKKQGELGKKMKGLGQKPGEQQGKKSGKKGQKSGSGQSEKSGGLKGNQSGKGNSEGNAAQGEKQSENGRWSAQLYELYKQQMQLKNQLKDLIQKEGYDENYKRMLHSMDELGAELLRKGVSRKAQVLQQQIQQELWKMKDAAYRQQQKNQRQSQTNLKEFTNPIQMDMKKVEDYFHTIEILNRQSLPLQPYYKRIVQDYFINDDRVSN